MLSRLKIHSEGQNSSLRLFLLQTDLGTGTTETRFLGLGTDTVHAWAHGVHWASFSPTGVFIRRLEAHTDSWSATKRGGAGF